MFRNTSESLATPEGSMKMRSGSIQPRMERRALPKSPEMLQQMQPAVSSVMATLVPWRKAASTFTSPYSFSTSTIFSSA